MGHYNSRFAKFVHKAEPFSLLLAYITIGWCAYSAWFHPTAASSNILTVTDQIVQAILFTLGALLCLYGHFSGKLFVEQLGVICSTVGTSLYLFVIASFVIRSGQFWDYSLLIGLVFLVVCLLINRTVKIQGILSSKWLKPSVQHIYDGME